MENNCFYDSKIVKFTLECFTFKLKNDYKFTVLFLLFSLIILYAIIVNLIILISILIEKLKNRLDICFISNAISDILIGLFVLPVIAVYSLFGYIPLTEFYCSIWITLDFTISTTSLLHFTYISYDRYLSVLKPVKYSSNNRHTITYIILISLYIISALSWLPVILYFKSRNINKSNIFSLALANQTNETFLYSCSFEVLPLVAIPHSFIIYFLPMFFIFSFYSKTIKMLNSKIRRRSSYSLAKPLASFSNKQSNDDDSDENSKLSSFRKITRDLFNKTKKKTDSNPDQLIDANDTTLKDDTLEIGNETTTNELTNNETSHFISNKTIIISENNRVKIFIKCKHFSDLTLNNINIEENKILNFEPLINLLTSDSVGKRSAQSLNDIETFKIQEHKVNNSKSKSISEFRCNSTENDYFKTKSDFKSQINIAKSLIKTMGKKTIKFASAQSVKKRISESDALQWRRQSEINPFDVQATRNRRKSLTQREKNITYKLGLIMLLVVVSWVPISVLWPLSSSCLKCVPNNVYLFSLWLQYVNSLLSPLILITSNSKYSLLIYLIKNLLYKKD